MISIVAMLISGINAHPTEKSSFLRNASHWIHPTSKEYTIRPIKIGARSNSSWLIPPDVPYSIRYGKYFSTKQWLQFSVDGNPSPNPNMAIAGAATHQPDTGIFALRNCHCTNAWRVVKASRGYTQSILPIGNAEHVPQ